MTVEIQYTGLSGNNLFQYICARLFAEQNGLQLVTPCNRSELVTMAPHKKGEMVGGPPVYIDDQDKDILDRQWPKAHYIFRGYFQKSRWYWSRRKEILEFATPVPEISQVDSHNLLVSLRVRADYRKLNWVIDPSWFLGIIEKELFDRLYIVTDYMDKEYLAHFKKYDPVIVSRGTEGNWKFMRYFERHVMANSTFSWWAVFFGNPTRTYVFKPWNARPRPRLVEFPGAIAVDGRFEVSPPL